MSTEKEPTDGTSMLDLYEHPGHLLRRAQQISTALFYDEIGSDLTPVQYAMLNTLAAHPGIDQVSLSGLVAIDTSTGATVCARLEEKQLIERKVLPHNRRQRALTVTAAGQHLLDALGPNTQRLRQRLLAPLSEEEQLQFMTLLGKLVRENNDQSRVPQTAVASAQRR
ncbi:MarR family winged helix-turn-helix transcriptional regulator [Massilia sp. 9096]|uniref:MarR family winged helix-turn-helix transcriptional regulator n=1 Tax=Massilia sp. 9096 TaxID=1500894 RepID=UPI00055C11A7|nr:MarR family winged helix-turn-helix transcriptional regulator [Massilia sp. 9096]